MLTACPRVIVKSCYTLLTGCHEETKKIIVFDLFQKSIGLWISEFAEILGV